MKTTGLPSNCQCEGGSDADAWTISDSFLSVASGRFLTAPLVRVFFFLLHDTTQHAFGATANREHEKHEAGSSRPPEADSRYD